MPSRATIKEIGTREIESTLRKYIREWWIDPDDREHRGNLAAYVVHRFARDGWLFGAFAENVQLTEDYLKAIISDHWATTANLSSEDRTSQGNQRFIAERLYTDGFHHAT